MTTITLDTNTIHRLLDLKHELKICDETGRILGRFLPERTITSPYSEEELDAIGKEPGGRTLAEILKDLENK